MIVKLTEIKKIKHMTKAMLFKIDEATKIDIRPQVFKIKTNEVKAYITKTLQ